jgi:hypothetical protein
VNTIRSLPICSLFFVFEELGVSKSLPEIEKPFKNLGKYAEIQ